MKPTLFTLAMLASSIATQPAAQELPSPFELKGFAPGVDIASVDTKGCRASDMVDSGMPGFVCSTTIGGDQAELKLATFEGKVTAVLVHVEGALMTPTLDALSEKYGRPVQSNRYIKDYRWTKDGYTMGIAEQRIRPGYDIMIMSFKLLDKAKASAAKKAKKDI